MARITYVPNRVIDANGISDGASIYVYQSGSTTPVSLYSNEALTTPVSNPYVVAAGAAVPTLYHGHSGNVRVRIVASDGSVPADDDPYSGPVSAAELSATTGAERVGWASSETDATAQTVDDVLQALPLTPQDFGVTALTTNHTSAFQKLATAYFTSGRAVHFPDLGYAYTIDPDTVIFTPPTSYNYAYRRPPAITCDKSVIIKARTAGASANFLVQFGTKASDYSGYLRDADFDLPEADANGCTFAKGAYYFPFFLDLRVNLRVTNWLGKAVQFGDTTAPSASAGVKGIRDYGRNLNLYRRDSVSITNAVNPVVTFAAAHGLWPSTGRRCMSINFSGSPVGWSAIAGKALDVQVLSSTTVQLLNVDSTGYGTFTGTASCYLNLPSMKISKKITGVTNANPAVVTTAVPHLLTSGDTVDIAEIFGMPTLIGQYVATVLTATTFSIPVNTTSTTTWGTWSSFCPGWVMPWVAPSACDIAEYCDNATDIDDDGLYVRHARIGQYHNPATCGYDGKHSSAHFYSFPETAEMLCAYYLGGDNNCVQIQADGPFRYVYWAVGPRNASSHTSTNMGYIDPKHQYGCLVRTETGAEWSSHADRLKGRSSYHMYTEHVGLGTYSCADMIYSSVAAPNYELGQGRIAARIVFDGATPVAKNTFQATLGGRTPGGDANGDWYVTFSRAVPLDAYLEISAAGAVDTVVTEDHTWGSRTTFARRIRARVAGAAADVARISVTWRYA